MLEGEVAGMLPLLNGHIGDRQGCERLFESWLGDHSSFELVYIADGRGRQYVDNITWRHGKIVHDPAGYGRDWSGRPWYRDAVHNEEIRSTDIYRSTATGDFCFTVTAALRNGGRKILGVIGADVNFQRLLEG
ncbi:MAG: PDC sensor domain-containing protein [Syntrophales bacterium]|nr:PDC sensor domain-containing protein [Syntrophales bacterium]